MKRWLLILAFGLCGCTADAGSPYLSGDFADTPALASQLLKNGILGKDHGIIVVEMVRKNGARFFMDGKPLDNEGEDVEFWIWHKTAGFRLANDAVRDAIDEEENKHPSDSFLLPGALGPFLKRMIEATGS